MPAPTKVNNIFALLGKTESTYGGGGTLVPATDTLPLLLSDPRQGISLTRTPLYDGDLGADPMSLAPTRRAQPTGFKGTLSPTLRFGGPGVAYAASVTSTLHRYLLTSGWQGTLTTTPGSEKWDYDPEVDPWNTWNRDTMVFNAYRAGEMWAVLAAMGSMKFASEKSAPWLFTFDYVGQSVSPVDAAFPAVSLPNYVYPLGSATTITIGSFGTARVMSVSFEDGQDLSTDRDAMNADGGYDGAVPGPRKTKLKVTVEAGAFVGTPFHTISGLNPYRLHELGTVLAVTLQQGTAQYARYKMSMPYCQVSMITPATNNAQPLWELELVPTPSVPGANDYIRITTD